MNERLRMTYLKTLGLDMYVPRWVLPAAAPSPQAMLPMEVARQSLVTGDLVKQSADNDNPASAILGELLRKTSVSAFDSAEEAARPSGSAVGGALQNVRFTLNVWRVSSSLLVVDSHVPKAALPTVTLLRNMLAVKQIGPTLPPVDTLTWPMFKGHLDQSGLTQARDMVSAFLQSRLEQKPVKYLWLMGESAYNAVAPQPGTFSVHVGQAMDLPSLGCLALIMPSLSEMLQNPMLKPLAWRAFRAYQLNE